MADINTIETTVETDTKNFWDKYSIAIIAFAVGFLIGTIFF